MKNLFKITLITAFGIISLQSCSDDDDNNKVVAEAVTKEAVVKNYANMVYNNYNDSYNDAVAMQTAIKAFTANPTAETMQSAKDAWLKARDTYGQTEVYRGSNGPIDTESNDAWTINNEGQLNAWPLDEAYIDYVVANNGYAGSYTFDQSIIGGTEEITTDLLIGKNEGVNEKSVSTGWHAIEFLLWGQDETNPSEKKAGQRKYTDYTTADNAERRKTYLNVVTDLVVTDLADLVATWKSGGTYYKEFMSLSADQALLNIVNGPQFLATSELSAERMIAPVKNGEGIDGSGQEDEHSCFSDNTHRDVYMNAKGIVNVLTGKYGSVSGASFVALVTQKDAEQGAKLQASIDAMWAKIEALDKKAKAGTPFDAMLLQEELTSPGTIVNAAQALIDLGDVIHESADKVGVKTTIEFE